MPFAYQFSYKKNDSEDDPFQCYLECDQCTKIIEKTNTRCKNKVCIGLDNPPFCHAHMKSELHLQVKNVQGMGKGLFAYDKSKMDGVLPVFKRNDHICFYNGIQISRKEEIQRYGATAQFAGPYTAGDIKTEDAACKRGLGAMINHSSDAFNAAIVYEQIKRKRKIIKRIYSIQAIDDIRHGEQILVNYGYDPLEMLQYVTTFTKYKKRI